MVSAYQAITERERIQESTARASLVDEIRNITNDQPADAATLQLVRSIVENAERLGLVWKLRPATVAAPSATGAVRVVVDGTSVPIRAVSLIGVLPIGGRVMVVLSPPAGVHVIGFINLAAGLSAVVGGKQWETGGGWFSTGHAGSELVTNMDTGPLLLSPMYRYRIHVKVIYLPTVSASTTWWIMRVRMDTTGGTQIAEQVFTTANTSFGEEMEFTVAFRPTSTTTTNYILTCQRLYGPASLDISKGGSNNQPFMIVHQDCPQSSITWL